MCQRPLKGLKNTRRVILKNKEDWVLLNQQPSSGWGEQALSLKGKPSLVEDVIYSFYSFLSSHIIKNYDACEMLGKYDKNSKER